LQRFCLTHRKKTARKVAERIHRKIKEKLYPKYNVTVSIGVADAKDGEDVVKMADNTLYEAKRNGKDRIWMTRE